MNRSGLVLDCCGFPQFHSLRIFIQQFVLLETSLLSSREAFSVAWIYSASTTFSRLKQAWPLWSRICLSDKFELTRSKSAESWRLSDLITKARNGSLPLPSQDLIPTDQLNFCWLQKYRSFLTLEDRIPNGHHTLDSPPPLWRASSSSSRLYLQI